jgi:hypothetical protein
MTGYAADDYADIARRQKELSSPHSAPGSYGIWYKGGTSDGCWVFITLSGDFWITPLVPPSMWKSREDAENALDNATSEEPHERENPLRSPPLPRRRAVKSGGARLSAVLHHGLRQPASYSFPGNYSRKWNDKK